MEILDLKEYDGKGIWFLGQELIRTLHGEGCVDSGLWSQHTCPWSSEILQRVGLEGLVCSLRGR